MDKEPGFEYYLSILEDYFYKWKKNLLQGYEWVEQYSSVFYNYLELKGISSRKREKLIKVIYKLNEDNALRLNLKKRNLEISLSSVRQCNKEEKTIFWRLMKKDYNLLLVLSFYCTVVKSNR